ncbi:MAG: SAM-dependent DNA methyltransferase, partial [Phycisphaerales bacterium]|nr:SAM-dependent DNA methyltransferase [Phycisphaerales bacterium]
MLHGVDNPTLEYMDTLSNAFPEQLPDAAADAYDIILANPPFKGAIDYEQIHRSLSSKLKTRKTELLFPLLMLRMLRLGGRCACIVPEGVLFGSSRAHRDLRRILIEDHKLDAVISMPSGVFKPYSGVSTAVLLFQRTDTGGTGEEFAKSKKAGLNTEAIWFYRMEHDGFTLDDKRTKTDDNNIPDVITRFHARHDEKQTDRTKNHFAVPVEEIREAKYDLSVSRYREIPYEAPDLDPPEVILDQLEKLEAEIAADLKALREAIA